MSKKNNNATTTTSKTTSTNNATTSSMSSSVGVMSAKDFKQSSYDAYIAYVGFIEGNKSIDETVAALSPLMSEYGFQLTSDNLANVLTVKMTAFGKDKGEQAKKVKSISTFRAFVKGGWKDVVSAPVHSNAGKNPAASKPEKAKKATKAELEETVKALMAQIAAMTPADDTATDTTATDENEAA